MHRAHVRPLAEVLAELETCSAVARPLRVYFDTANIQDLSELAVDHAMRRTLVLASQQGVLRTVLSTLHCIEFAKKPPHLRQRIAGLLEGLISSRLIGWVRPTGELRRREWHRVAEHDGDGQLPDSEVFVDDWVDALERGERSNLLLLRERSFAELVEGFAARLSSEYWVASRGLTFAAEHQQGRRAGLPREAKRYKPVEIASRVLTTLPSDLIDSGKVAAVLGKPVPYDRMPAHRITVAYEEGNELGSMGRQDTDAEDKYHLGSAVYCDLAFVDRQTHERLVVAGHCPARIRRNGELAELMAWIAARTGTGAA
jgi:hypothetical protein